MNEPKLPRLLGRENPVPALMSSYEFRPQQLEFSEWIEKSLLLKAHAVIEAGTGIGKTIGYLVPILMSQQRVLISTYTKLLQDQVINNDLAIAAEIAGAHRKVHVLKGRENYVCREKLQQAVRSAEPMSTSNIEASLMDVWQWSTSSRFGDLSELTDLEPSVHALVTAPAAECLNTLCPSYADCSYFQARDRARGADVLIVNHQLLMAGSLPENDLTHQLLESFDVCLIDEAEQWPGIVREAASLVYDLNWLTVFSKDLQGEVGAGALGDETLSRWSGRLRATREEIDRRFESEDNAGPMSPAHKMQVLLMCDQLEGLLSGLIKVLQVRGSRSLRIRQLSDQCAGQLDRIMALAGDLEVDAQRYFWRSGGQGISWYRSDGWFQDHVEGSLNKAASFMNALTCIFVSASMTVNESFDFFLQQLPITIETMHRIGSPFDFSRQVLGYKPTVLPSPQSEEHVSQLLSAIDPLLDRKALILVTSHKALASAAQYLRGNKGRLLFIQGEQGAATLVEAFKAAKSGILLVTMGHWQGMDLAGANVDCLVMDRLPFKSPTDPLLQSIRQGLEDRESDFFLEFLLPDCAQRLRQGFGRLIRKGSDRGVFVMGDARYWDASYAQYLQDNLPTFDWTSTLSDAIEFIGV
jgi:ATP-dependent DNA helicase DinG